MHFNHSSINRSDAVRHHWPKSLPIDQDRAEVRVLAAVLSFFFMCHLIEPYIYSRLLDTSIISKLVDLTTWPWLTETLFAVSALLALPHLVSLIFMPRLLHCRLPRKMAVGGACLAALLWFYLGNVAKPLDYYPLPYIYFARTLLDAAVAGVFAFSLNSQQLRKVVYESRQAA